jgi:hypothetical protein
MLKVNEYFNGNVKSIGFESTDGPVTAGVMDKGDYEFSTSKKEIMVITSGEMTVLLPNEKDWKKFKPFDKFEVEANLSFKLKIGSPVSYLCYYK